MNSIKSFTIYHKSVTKTFREFEFFLMKNIQGKHLCKGDNSVFGRTICLETEYILKELLFYYGLMGSKVQYAGNYCI